MTSVARRLWNRVRALRPLEGYFFDRPLLLLQSDDWGRVGVRDHEGFEGLRAAGLNLGERPYDFYSLETAGDVAALSRFLKSHRDANGRPACLTMNFITANPDFARMAAEDFREIHLRALPDGLPDVWLRAGLFEAYREGAEAGVFYPALHGLTHFCRPAVERELSAGGERAGLLKTLWRAGTPYIYWRMPWVGYEYWNPEQPPHFLSADSQDHAIGAAVGNFARLFSTLPRSACAPGYRANADTHRAWAHYGVRVAQNGPGTSTPPHSDEFGLLHLYRTLDFEPALEEGLSVEAGAKAVSESFALGIPAIVSIHSINFQSSLRDSRSRTVGLLDQFLTLVEAQHPDLLYLHDGDIYDLVQTGAYVYEGKSVTVGVSRRRLTKSGAGKP